MTELEARGSVLQRPIETMWKKGDVLHALLRTDPEPGLRVRAALAEADTLTRALGRPDREQVVTRRDSIATTLQALELTKRRPGSRAMLKQGRRPGSRTSRGEDRPPG